MNKNKIRMIAAPLIVGAMLMTAGCGEVNPLKSSAADKKTVMTVGGEKVAYQEYRYFWMNNKRDLYGADAELTPEQTEKIKQLVETNVTDRHALRLLAAEYGVELTDEDRMRADAYVDSFRTDCGDDDTYKEMLIEQYLNEPLFIELTSDTTIAYALLDEMGAQGGIDVSDKAYEEALKSDEVLCIKEIYINYPSAEYKDWALNRANEALGKLKAGESFESLMAEYSNYNPDDLPPEHGYYTMEYDAIEEVWNAAKSLKEGEYSGIVETAFGYHIVMRAPKDYSYMDTIRDELYEIFRQSRFYEKFYEYRAGIEVDYTSYGEKLDLSEIS
ncbi:MAG: peptidylprolyl isomerase [Candidatus Flemingiibacterium sp.]